MIHLHPEHIPFALALLPFLTFGMALPATLRDWIRGRMMRGDGISLIVGLVIVVAWDWVILQTVKSKRRLGKLTFWGRQRGSWLWAPFLAFVAGIICGLFALG